jgi:hypothetical protein
MLKQQARIVTYVSLRRRRGVPSATSDGARAFGQTSRRRRKRKIVHYGITLKGLECSCKEDTMEGIDLQIHPFL